MAKADHIVGFSLDTRSERHDKGWDHPRQGGTKYGCDIRSGGTIYSAMDGPEGPILRGDHPRRAGVQFFFVSVFRITPIYLHLQTLLL